MSATIESDLFSMYFAVPVRGRVEGAPVITVEGKSFPVVECYLDDLYELTGVSTLTLLSTSTFCLNSQMHCKLQNVQGIARTGLQLARIVKAGQAT